jgi:hypothetical protein
VTDPLATPSPLMKNLDEFKTFCCELLKRLGYSIEPKDAHFQDVLFGPQLVVRSPIGGDLVVVSMRLYPTKIVDDILVSHLRHSLWAYSGSLGANRGIAIILGKPTTKAATEAYASEAQELWDVDRLLALTRPHRDLSAELATVIEAIAGPTPDWLREAHRELRERAGPTQDTQAAANLIRQLQTCPIGKDGAQEFERVCESAFRHLFSTEFSGWAPQHVVERGFHRIDLVARLVPQHDFWLALAQDFRSRYIVFEFKNYRGPINQDQVYTTEKYLYTHALRAVAIVVARSGISRSGMHAARGALREQGKLILCLSASDVETMLRYKISGTDPTALLVERVDAMLTDLGR